MPFFTLLKLHWHHWLSFTPFIIGKREDWLCQYCSIWLRSIWVFWAIMWYQQISITPSHVWLNFLCDLQAPENETTRSRNQKSHRWTHSFRKPMVRYINTIYLFSVLMENYRYRLKSNVTKLTLPTVFTWMNSCKTPFQTSLVTWLVKRRSLTLTTCII